MDIAALTGLDQSYVIGFAMVTGWLLTCYLIGRFGVSQGKSFWQIFFVSLLVGPAIGAIVAALPGAGTIVNSRATVLRP